MSDLDLSKIFRELDKHFLEYITEQGRIPSNGWIRCINPNHPDRNPSMHIIDSGEHSNTAGYCFSCHAHVSILNACHYLEGKPITGIGFYEETLPYLCKKYGIAYEPIQIDNKTRDMYQKRSGVRDAINVIHGSAFIGTTLNTTHSGIQHLLNRGITEATIKKFKIGVVNSTKEYLDAMKTIGYTDREWLDIADLARRTIFNPDAFLIPIYDDKSRPVGFVSRTTKMAPNDKGDQKYVNSINSDIYCKAEVLFSLNNYDPDNGPLWIVEGYVDTLYLDQCGLKNVVALGSTALTEQHVDLLSRRGIKNVILCLDGDEGGRIGTKRAIEQMTPYQTFKSIRIIELPEGSDPDSFVREHGLEELKKLAHPNVAISPFAWMLKHATFQDDMVQLAASAIPTIAAEESAIKRIKMINELAKITGISKGDIQKDVELGLNKESDKFIEELTEVNKYAQTALNRRKIRETRSILEEAICKVKNIEIKYNNIIDNRSSYDQKKTSLWTKIEHGDYKYGLYAPNFKKLEEMYDGIPYTTNLTLVGGKPSAGKTTWLQALSLDIVEANEDVAVFFMSIDDTTELMTFKMLAQRTGFSTSKIKKYSTLLEDEQQVIRKGWNWLDNLSKRFIMADATEGTTPDALEAHIEWFKKEFPDKKRLFFLDNFHKLTLPSSNKQKTDAISLLSDRVKELTRIHDTHIIMTTELRKMSENNSRPSPADLKDTVQLEYDADSIIMVHNDLLVKEDTNIVWNGDYGTEGSRAMPYLEVYLYKNKHTGKTGGLAYRLNTYNLQIYEDSYATVRSLKAQNAGHQIVKSSSRIH